MAGGVYCSVDHASTVLRYGDTRSSGFKRVSEPLWICPFSLPFQNEENALAVYDKEGEFFVVELEEEGSDAMASGENTTASTCMQRGPEASVKKNGAGAALEEPEQAKPNSCSSNSSSTGETGIHVDAAVETPKPQTSGLSERRSRKGVGSTEGSTGDAAFSHGDSGDAATEATSRLVLDYLYQPGSYATKEGPLNRLWVGKR